MELFGPCISLILTSWFESACCYLSFFYITVNDHKGYPKVFQMSWFVLKKTSLPRNIQTQFQTALAGTLAPGHTSHIRAVELLVHNQQLNGGSLFAGRQHDITRLLFLPLAVFGKCLWLQTHVHTHRHIHTRVHTKPTFAGLCGFATNPEWQLLLQIYHILHFLNPCLPLLFFSIATVSMSFFSLLLVFLDPPLLTWDLFPLLCISMSWIEAVKKGKKKSIHAWFRSLALKTEITSRRVFIFLCWS